MVFRERRATVKTDRHQAIVQLIRQHETLTTEDLADLLHVSKETIRRDLNALQAQERSSVSMAVPKVSSAILRTAVTLSAPA